MKHTPGPWEWDGNPCSYDPENEAPWLYQAPWKARESFPILTGSIKCGNESDASLIAAAPDLLQALKQMLDAFYHDPLGGGQDAAVEAALRAAAKAEGK